MSVLSVVHRGEQQTKRTLLGALDNPHVISPPRRVSDLP
ncbi:hypothetical protein Pd630_LPD09020 (plasmid) [Rhodococcus opacus PD630]|nr:hypothetical protein Pd630_LPD09020 [Rhodococcus opacus PD630]